MAPDRNRQPGVLQELSMKGRQHTGQSELVDSSGEKSQLSAVFEEQEAIRIRRW